MSKIDRADINTLDAEDLEYYECEEDDGSGTHEIVSFECVTRAHFGCTLEDPEPSSLSFETDVLWFDCSCGHQTYV